MGKKKQTQTTKTVTTPTNPAWVDSGLQGLGGKITDYGAIDPYSLVAGPDALQTQAAQGAASLTSPQGYQDASDIFKRIGGQGASTYAPSTYGGTSVGPASQWGGTSVGPASQWGGANIEPVQQAQSASLLENLQQYMSPYTKDVVDTSLADYDEGAGQTRAQQTLDMARAKAFGGSGSAITRSMTEDALTRGRGTLSAGLRDQAFQRGAALSSEDAARRQQSSQFNASSDLQRALAQAQLSQQTGMFNTDAANSNSQLAAQLAQQTGMFNTDAVNQAGQYNAGAQDTSLARQMAAAGGMADVAGQQSASDRANIGLQGDLGAQLQQLAQARAQAPTSQLINQSGLFGSLPLNLLHGETTDGTQTTKESGGALGTLASLAMLAAAPFTGGATLLGTLGMGAGTAAALGTAGKLAMTANAAKGLMRG